jgi:dTDP-D-glucose 4,6-dehydratase
MGTHVLLESAKVAKISRFIHVSTDEVYGEQTNEQEAMSEEQVLQRVPPVIYSVITSILIFRLAVHISATLRI